LGDAAPARSFVSAYSDERRLWALFALGRIKSADAKDAEETIGVLTPFVDAAHGEAAPAMPSCRCSSSAIAFPLWHRPTCPKTIAVAAVMPTPDLLLNSPKALGYMLNSSIAPLLSAPWSHSRGPIKSAMRYFEVRCPDAGGRLMHEASGPLTCIGC
jgi:hypothetical protein